MVAEEGFGVLVCCGKEMTLVGVKGMVATWTSAVHKPEGGATFVYTICKQKIKAIVETTGILECCGQRMQRVEGNPD